MSSLSFADRPESTFLIVPSVQFARKLMTRWAREGHGLVNVRALTPVGLAKRVLEETSPVSSFRTTPELSSLLAIDESLRADSTAALKWSGQGVLRTITALRGAGIRPSEYPTLHPGKHISGPTAAAFESYERWMTSEGVRDEAAFFLEASKCVPEWDASGELLLLADTHLSALAARFLKAIEDRLGPMRLIDADEDTDRPGLAGRLFADRARVQSFSPEVPQHRTARVPSIEDQARFVFQDVLDRGIAFDDVEVAYPRYVPYLPLLLSQARLRRIPITTAAGIPVTDLPAGQALRLFLAWLGSGLDSGDLLLLVRSGLLDGEDWPEAASALMPIHVRGPWPAYQKAFKHLRKDQRKSGLESFDLGVEAVRRLHEAVPSADASASEFAQSLRRFVTRFTHKPEDAASSESRGREDLLQRFLLIEEGPDSRHSRNHLVERFSGFLSGLIVQARADRPGHIHVTPLDSAGVAGRSHLYVIGLDDAHFLGSASEDVFLPDEICASQPDALPGTADRRSAQSALVRRALKRTPGVSTVIASFDRAGIHGGGGPTPYFFQLEGSASASVDAAPRMAPGVTPFLLDARGTLSARKALRTWFPSVAAGLSAAEERASGAFTEFDAALGSLPFLGEKVRARWAASRLERLAACPFRHFLQDILGLRPLEEREAGEWMSAMERGLLIHDGLDRFHQRVQRGEVALTDADAAFSSLEGVFEAFREERSEPNAFAWSDMLAELRLIAQLAAKGDALVVASELVFGLPGARPEHREPLDLDLGDASLRLGGRIDLVLERNGELEVTDFKTGGASSYNREDPLQDGKRLQWALYGFAVEQMLGRTPGKSGYAFVSRKESGLQLHAPLPPKEEVGAVVSGLQDLARAGLFGAAAGSPECRYCDHKRVCGDLDRRKGEMQEKIRNERDDRTELSGWSYARKVK